MSAASGASTVANAASGELGARGRRSSLTDDRSTLVADDQCATRMTHCRRLARANFRRSNGRDAEDADIRSLFEQVLSLPRRHVRLSFRSRNCAGSATEFNDGKRPSADRAPDSHYAAHPRLAADGYLAIQRGDQTLLHSVIHVKSQQVRPRVMPRDIDRCLCAAH